jgi:sec-independent protein translocase protein TatC
MAKTKKNPDQMSFMDHLEELRWLLVRSSIAILITATATFFVSGYIFDDIIFGPTKTDFITYELFCKVSRHFGADESICVSEMPFIIQNTDMEGQFTILIWTCITAGFILGFPYILWELWKFIRPALYEKERKNAKLIISSASLLFFLGVLFGYFIIVPLSVNFFATFTVSDVIKNEFNLHSYVGMIKTSVIACGLFFEMPVVMYFLAKLDLVTPESLRKYRKIAIVVILIAAAIVTPPDVISQVIVALPMMLVYEAGIIITRIVQRKNPKALSNV